MSDLKRDSSAFQTLSALFDGALGTEDLEVARNLLGEQAKDLAEWESSFLRARIAIAGSRDDEAMNLLRSCMSMHPEKTEATLRGVLERSASSHSPSTALRFLELLHDLVPEAKQKKVQREIAGYRSKHGLGQVWSFFGGDKSLALECTSLNEIRDKLLSGVIQREMSCRRNLIGPLRPVEDRLSEDGPQFELLFRPVRYYGVRWAGGMAILGFLGSFLYTFYNVSRVFHIGFFRTFFFGVCYLVLIAGLARGQVLVAVIAGFIGVVLSRGYISTGLGMLGFVLGNLLSNALSALAVGLAGYIVGAGIGLVRRPFLQKLS